MGLAGTKIKQRFGNDPRNTNWSNDTSRFGHQYLAKMGWQQGSGLGLVSHALTTHVKVSIKDDNLGLGAKLHKRKANGDGGLEEEGTAGLDAFQRILGRLNGKENVVNKVLDNVRDDDIINGKWGMRFVKGETLLSTWDKESKKLISYKNIEDDGKKSRKRKADESETKEDKKTLKKHKKEKKDKKEKKEKKKKKEKKDKKDKKDKIRTGSDETLVSKESSATQPPIATRLSARSKWIKQKRASVMDSKALNEIFMITN